MPPIIEVNHVWKAYQKGIDRRYKSLRDTLVDIPGRLFGGEKELFWALEDINFNVEAGESVGIIGRNGAGKSTLLKILSRITPPTKGEIILRGRVASLLEVGTGFHPELTGRENVFFNGSILGMRHQEIKKKFDEIVNFSGVERFIDTPLKHYSSGMQMRLAFSVAAHLNAEILLIDEVLAVGDAEFQKKCIGKMDEVSKGEGKTILFVSHDTNSIRKLTNIAILLEDGSLKYKGTTNEILSIYFKDAKMNYMNFTNNNYVKQIRVEVNDTIKIYCEYDFYEVPLIPHFGFLISTFDFIPIIASNPTIAKYIYKPYFTQKGTVIVEINEPILFNGLYNLSIWIGDGNQDFFSSENCIQFEINNNINPSKYGMIKSNCKFTYVH
jgi:lipopolysaccharide transport system ATP-binding protein